MANNKDIKDGLYLFYVKDKQIHPVIQSEDSWNILQGLGNAIVGGPVQVLDTPMGYVEQFRKE
ncbi:MAG: hypothetical protein GX053_12750 [Tissierella sp.]|nr:hypothetical protein [Tissierella sp.]